MYLQLLLLLLSLGSLTPTLADDGVECPGVVKGGRVNEGYCCVGGTLNLSNCPGWPICTGPTSFDPRSTTLSCATTIPTTASDYSQLISSASASFYGSNPGIAMTHATAMSSAGASQTMGSGAQSSATGKGDAVGSNADGLAAGLIAGLVAAGMAL